MIKDVIKETLLQYLGTLRTSPSGWQTRDCPVCVHRGQTRDKKNRFGLNVAADDVITVHCFNCFFSAKYVPGRTLSKDFVWFLNAIGVPESDIHKLKFGAYREKETGRSVANVNLDGQIFKKWSEIQPLPGSAPITFWAERNCKDTNFLQCMEYAIERRLNLADVYWTPNTEYAINKRIVLPFYYEDRQVGYTARYAGVPPNNSVPRYINKMPPDFVYNLDNQKHYYQKYVILCEGVFDAYLTCGVSCMGTINQNQIRIINGLGKKVIVCPDRDKPGDRLVEVAIEQKWAVSFPNWGKGVKDAACAVQTFGKILTLQSIIDSSETNVLKINVKRKMDRI